MSRSVLVMLTHPSAEDADGGTAEPDFWLADPLQPQISVLDFAVTRGDGIFESISVIGGHPHALDAHLERLSRSAAALELPPPKLTVWRDAIAAALAELDPVPEASLRAVFSRGVEGEGQPTAWVYAAPTPDFSRVRVAGVRVVLLDRGYRHDAGRTSPWLLVGAKTLSYAVNRAAIREAVRRGADEVIFVSSDGYVLEGATSSVVYRRGDRLLTPGDPDGLSVGVLDGTTQGDVFRWAQKAGLDTGVELVTPGQLVAAESIWLVSSARHAVPVRELDGIAHPVDEATTAAINSFLMHREH